MLPNRSSLSQLAEAGGLYACLRRGAFPAGEHRLARPISAGAAEVVTASYGR